MVLWPFHMHFLLLVASLELCLPFIPDSWSAGSPIHGLQEWSGRPQPMPTRTSHFPGHTDGLSRTQALGLECSQLSPTPVSSISSLTPTWKGKRLKLLQWSCYRQGENVWDLRLEPRRRIWNPGGREGSGPDSTVGMSAPGSGWKAARPPGRLFPQPLSSFCLFCIVLLTHVWTKGWVRLCSVNILIHWWNLIRFFLVGDEMCFLYSALRTVT